MSQLTIEDAIHGVGPDARIQFEIVHQEGDTKKVYWVADAPGFILADWPLVGDIKFRSKKGVGLGVVKKWHITKTELARLRREIEG